MKTLSIITSIMVLSIWSCKKTDNVSRLVTVPEMEVVGSKFITINVGGTMPVDEGARVINDEPVEGGSNVKAVENTVDLNTPGIYYMLYQTRTKNGYTVGAARYIAVTDYSDDTDLSGTYMRTANGVLVEVTRESRALYKNSDMGGAGLADALYFAVINDSTIEAGPQYSESIGDVIDASGEALSIEPGNTFFRYALDAPGYGTTARTFVKQD